MRLHEKMLKARLSKMGGGLDRLGLSTKNAERAEKPS
jgi:hypothetical protein